MVKKITAFSDIIYPIDETTFHNEYFEAKPLLVQRNSPAYFQELITMNIMATYLERKDIVYPFLKMVKDGMPLPMAFYIHEYEFAGRTLERIDNEKMFSLFADGATITCQQLNYSFPSFYELSHNLANHFKTGLNINSYFTPASAKALQPHYDMHEVFVLQVYGSKTWKLYDMPYESPAVSFDRKKWVPTQPSLEVKLEQGDTLYIPKGFVHEAFATDEPSLHITIGIAMASWLSVLKQITEEAASIKGFRRSFKWHLLSENEIKEIIAGLTEELLKQTAYQDIPSTYAEQHAKRRFSGHTKRLTDILGLSSITPDTVLSYRKECNAVMSETRGKIEILVYDKKLVFPLAAKELLNEILQVPQFQVAGLAEKYRHTDVLALVKELVKSGFLGIVSPG